MTPLSDEYLDLTEKTGKKIAVIDDEPTSVELLKNNLKKKEYEVTTAIDGVEGFMMVQDSKPDLIILDVHMPNVDGYMLVRDIKGVEELKDTPIIIVTGDETLEERFKKLGIQDYFTKPYDMAKMLARIDEVLMRVQRD